MAYFVISLEKEQLSAQNTFRKLRTAMFNPNITNGGEFLGHFNCFFLNVDAKASRLDS